MTAKSVLMNPQDLCVPPLSPLATPLKGLIFYVAKNPLSSIRDCQKIEKVTLPFVICTMAERFKSIPWMAFWLLWFYLILTTSC